MNHRIKNLVGQRFGRLLVLSDSGRRQPGSGEVYWTCKCDCGSDFEAHSGRLKAGHTGSCGCLAKERSAERGRARTKPPRKCKVEDCHDTIEKGARGYCGKHAQRVRRYSDPHYVTSEEERRLRSRESQLARIIEVKPNTYRKLLGRHEHRVIGEALAGRKLRSDEHVHHKDGNKHNNDPSNLQILTAQEHLALHARERGERR